MMKHLMVTQLTIGVVAGLMVGTYIIVVCKKALKEARKENPIIIDYEE